MTTTRERRMITGRVETRALTEAEKSAGYIGAIAGTIPFNADSEVLRDRRLNNGQPFVERIAPRAFSGATEVMAMAGHTDDTLAAFARQGANLTLTETDSEIRWEALLPNTSAARDLLEQVDKKVIRGTSFEFDLGGEDRWEKRGDGTAVRTVTKGTLRAVNPVVWPAYPDSALTVSMRGRERGARRGLYIGNDADYDYTLTCDARYAVDALCDELDELVDAMDYLRCCATPGTSSTGALKAYAERELAESTAAVKELTDWLAANGATVNPDLMDRAAAKLTEARALQPKFSPDATRERRRRVLSVPPVSPLHPQI